jgi:hypothetical protein
MKLRTCIWALTTEAGKDEGSLHDSTAQQATEKTMGTTKKEATTALNIPERERATWSSRTYYQKGSNF